MHAKFLVALLGGAVGWSLTGAVAQEDDERRRRTAALPVDGQHPLHENRRRQTVLFFHGRGRVYVNRLERECVGSCATASSRIKCRAARASAVCATDSITVLERTGRGFNCGLGMFEPISQDEADSFLVGPNRAVTSTPVEPPKRRASRLQPRRGPPPNEKGRTAAAVRPCVHEISGRASRECRGA